MSSDVEMWTSASPVLLDNELQDNWHQSEKQQAAAGSAGEQTGLQLGAAVLYWLGLLNSSASKFFFQQWIDLTLSIDVTNKERDIFQR